MIKCGKGTQTIFDECCGRQRKTFCDMGTVHVFNIRIICIHGEKLLRQLAFHQEYQRSHNETDVRRICKIGSEQDEIYGVKTINWENSIWK